MDSDDRPLTVELNKRALYVKEVCEAWGSRSNKASFLKGPPKYTAVVTTGKNVTYDRGFLSRNQLEDIWRMGKRSQFQKLVIDKKHQLTWCKVPKAASTSWVKIFLRVAGITEDVKDGPGGTLHKSFRKYYPHLSNSIVKKILPYHLKFLVTRHPFERLLSAYRDKLESYERDLQYGTGYFHIIYGKSIVKTYRNAYDNITQIEPTFREFVKYLIDTNAEAYDSHWQPIFNLCTPCRIKYDVISRMESLEIDSEYVLRHRQLENVGHLEWAHKTDAASNTTEVSINYFSQLLPSEIRQLYLKYLMDFILFDYDPEPYFHIVEMANKEGNEDDEAEDNDRDE